MNINELKSFRLSDAVHFHDELNPALWSDEELIPEVREQLLAIAQDFMEHLGVSDLDIVDIILCGSNAAYTYTKHSDIDLHLIADIEKLENDEIYRELFTAKKTVFNDSHDIKIHGYDVELYVQPSTEVVKSLGEYSVLKNKWIRRPSARRSSLDQTSTRHKFTKLVQLCELSLRSDDVERVQRLIDTIKKYRKAGLEFGGEFGPENLVVKALRSRGIIDKLYAHRDELHSAALSLDEMMALSEASGYIPSEAERDDPRFKTALTVDVTPNSIADNVRKLGLGPVKRAGVPQTMRGSGKVKRK